MINAGECVEKRERSDTVSRNVNWYSHYEEQSGSVYIHTQWDSMAESLPCSSETNN